MKTVSVIIPCLNESAGIGQLFTELGSACKCLTDYSWHIIVVDDGSVDDTSHITYTSMVEESDWCSGSVIRLSRNFGKEAAILAGLDAAQSDACILMDADLQDPPWLIPLLVKEWENGSDIVSTKRMSRSADSWVKSYTARLFYRIFKTTSKLDVEFDSSDYRLLDRYVVNAIISCRESVRFSKGFFAWAGFKRSTVDFERPARNFGKSAWGLWKLWNYALDGIFSFSTAPLRIWTYIGVSATIMSFLLSVRVLASVFADAKTVPGYASLFIVMTFLGGIQLMGIGLLGEYLGRTYVESKRRPSYVVAEIKRSSRLKSG